VGGLCNEEEEEEDREICAKLSVTLVTRKGISVAIVPNTVGTKAKEKKRWWTTGV